MKPCDTCAAAYEGVCLSILPDQPAVKEYWADGMFVAEILISVAGTFSPQHSHEYPHLTYLAQGAVRLHRDGAAPVEMTAPNAVTIPAGVKHLFETITNDVLLLCIHNTSRTGAVDVREIHQLEGVI